MKILWTVGALLLVSCAGGNVPKDIQAFVQGFDLEKTQKNLMSLSLAYEADFTNREGNRKDGSYKANFSAGNIANGHYHSTLHADFTGNQVFFDSESQIYVTTSQVEVTFDEEQNSWLGISTKKGFSDQALTIPSEDYVKREKLNATNIDIRKSKIFYTQDRNGRKSGGLYYGDFILGSIKYYEYMSIQNQKLQFKLENYPYKSETEEGIVQENILVDSMGMIDSMENQVTNFTKDVLSNASLKVDYVFQS